jgi:hypothetical protein
MDFERQENLSKTILVLKYGSKIYGQQPLWLCTIDLRKEQNCI